MTRTPDEIFVPIAEVVRVVGLRGEVKLYPLIDWYPPLLDTDYLIWENGDPLRIDRWRPSKSGAVIGVSGYERREDAEACVGMRIGFLRGRYRDAGFPRPESGLPFRFLGRPVVTVAGEAVGDVTEVRLYGAQFTLVIEREGGEILIPAVEPILAADSGCEGPLVIDPPEGLFDVN